MSSSTTQLDISHITIEEIALNAVPLLQALGLELGAAATGEAGQEQMQTQGIHEALPFIDDLGPLIIWK